MSASAESSGARGEGRAFWASFGVVGVVDPLRGRDEQSDERWGWDGAAAGGGGGKALVTCSSAAIPPRPGAR